MENNQEKPRYKYAVECAINGIVLEVKKGKLQRIRLNTSIGDITHKPFKEVVSTSNLSGFDLQEDSREEFEVSEFLVQYPLMKQINDLLKKGEVKVILSFGEFLKQYEEEELPVSYKFMNKEQFETLYCETIHKKDKTLIERQEAKRKKFEEVSDF